MPLPADPTPPPGDVPFHVTLSWAADGHANLVVSGELDHATVPLLARAIEAALERGDRDIVVDVGGVAFCDAGGVNCFVAARACAAAQNRHLYLVDASASLARLLAIVRVEHLLE